MIPIKRGTARRLGLDIPPPPRPLPPALAALSRLFGEIVPLAPFFKVRRSDIEEYSSP